MSIILNTMLLSAMSLNTYPLNINDNISIEHSEIAICSTNFIDGFTFWGGINNLKAIDENFGYVYYSINIYRTPYSNLSNLFLIENKLSFTPGVVAKQNGESGYEKFYLASGYVHMKAHQYYVDSDTRGSELIFKEMWPKSTSFSTTFTSSFSATLSASAGITSEVNVSEGAKLSPSLGVSLSLSYDESVAITYAEPKLSTQLSPDDNCEAQWSFKMTDKKAVYTSAGSSTYHLNTYYLFEMDNFSYIDCGSAAFWLDLEIKMSGREYISIIHNTESKEYSTTIDCFIAKN